MLGESSYSTSKVMADLVGSKEGFTMFLKSRIQLYLSLLPGTNRPEWDGGKDKEISLGVYFTELECRVS